MHASPKGQGWSSMRRTSPFLWGSNGGSACEVWGTQGDCFGRETLTSILRSPSDHL